MQRRRVLFLALAVPCAALAAETDPLARLDAEQRRAVQQLLKQHSRPHEGDAQADAVELADIDGDGKPDVVLLWTFLGPTFSWSRVSMLSRGGGGWRHAASADVNGQAERLRVQGREIAVDTLRLGPKDARCCPTVKKIQRIRWQVGKLVTAAQ